VIKLKNLTVKTALMWIFIVLGVFSFFVEGITPLQMLPLLMFIVFSILHLYASKDLRIGIIVLSIIMFLVNLNLFSVVDMVLWGIATVVYINKES